MRERFSAADIVRRTTLNQATPLITCKSSKRMERAKNGSRYFRNPPQPHMCIQDFIQGCNEPCYINVLSWIKISTPRQPEDPIPLYGGMRIPYNNTAGPSDKKNPSKKQPNLFAVMANPEILRLSGKTAKDPVDRDALVDLMIDFVEAMNPEVKFKRQFSVLKDRDLTGELKDIWLAIQVKREREKERAENGKKGEIGDKDKRRGSKDEELYQGAVKQQETKNVDQNEGVQVVDEWLSMDNEQSRETSKQDGAEKKLKESEPKNIALPQNPINKNSEQENGLQYNFSYHKEQKLVTTLPFDSAATEVPVRELNSVLSSYEKAAVPSRDAKSSPTHQRKSKIRSCKGELFTQTIRFDNAREQKSGESSSDMPCVNEIATITKRTLFKEIFPSSSDSSEDEEKGDLKLNGLYKVKNNGNDNPADSEQCLSFLHNTRILNINKNSMDNGKSKADIKTIHKNKSDTHPTSESNSSFKVAHVETSRSYENFETSNVKSYKCLRTKSSIVKKSTDKQGSVKQNVYLANKFKGTEKTESETVSCQASIAKFPGSDC